VLARGIPAPYGRSMERTRRWRTGWAVVVVAIGALIGLSVMLASASVRAYRARLEAGYAAQAEQMAATYARAVGRWWLRGDTEMMAEAARLMVVGSARFVRVVTGQETLVDLRDDDLAEEPALALGSDPTRAPATMKRSIGEALVLDVLAPIPVSGVERPIGTVRIGFDLTSVGGQARARAWGTAGVVAACDLIAIAAILGGMAMLSKRRRRIGRPSDADRALVRGGLRIDPLSKTVSVRGRPVGLTPKQFELLLLLAGVPDRVLSDADILAAVWPESPYADSRDVKQCVYTLRRRLGRVLETPSDVVVNVKGYGYKLAPPDDEAIVDPS